MHRVKTAKTFLDKMDCNAWLKTELTVGAGREDDIPALFRDVASDLLHQIGFHQSPKIMAVNPLHAHHEDPLILKESLSVNQIFVVEVCSTDATRLMRFIS